MTLRRRFFIFVNDLTQQLETHKPLGETKMITHTTVECLECAATITLPEDVMENELIVCDECGVELEIMSLDPIELDYAPEVEEDWGE